jgi:hypothetical protein
MDDGELYAFVEQFRRLTELAHERLSPPEHAPSVLVNRLTDHLGRPARELPVITDVHAGYDHANVQLAIDAWRRPARCTASPDRAASITASPSCWSASVTSTWDGARTGRARRVERATRNALAADAQGSIVARPGPVTIGAVATGRPVGAVVGLRSGMDRLGPERP